MELISTLFSTIFPLIIISPALLILLESDINILPSFLIQSPAYQRARTFNILVGSNINTYVDHYLVSSASFVRSYPIDNNPLMVNDNAIITMILSSSSLLLLLSYFHFIDMFFQDYDLLQQHNQNLVFPNIPINN